MTKSGPSPEPDPSRHFAHDAERANSSLLRELWGLVRTSRKWWLLPIIIILLVIGLLIILGSTAAAPFIYSLF